MMWSLLVKGPTLKHLRSAQAAIDKAGGGSPFIVLESQLKQEVTFLEQLLGY